MKVTFLSHMFPCEFSPHFVPFMVERARAIARLVQLQIIAPTSWFPCLKTKLPLPSTVFEGLTLKRPRYLALPAIFWGLRWVPYIQMLKSSSLANSIAKTDILHIEWIYPDAFAGVRSTKKKIKTVGVVHGNEAIEYFGPVGRRKKYIEALAHLDRIIVVSNDLKLKLVNEYSVEPQKISVILNGVDVEKFPLMGKKQARRDLGIPIDGPLGVCVARLSEEKNLHILIQAVAKLKHESPLIYIVGDGPLRHELRALISKLRVTDRVKLVGPIPHNEVALWLNAADYFYLPSQREGCPVVVHEALACGVPVISTAVGAIPDLIKDERYGLLCEPDSVSAFTAIMKRAMSKSWDRNIISDYGRQFTWDKMAKQTVEVFKSVLESGR